MDTHKVAIPSMADGLDAPICSHFGHAEKFLIVDYNTKTKEIGNVEVMVNPPHESGGCMRPVMLLKNKGVDTIILTGIGQRPLMGFIEQGISVLHGIDGTIRQNFDALGENKLPSVSQSLCNHSH